MKRTELWKNFSISKLAALVASGGLDRPVQLGPAVEAQHAVESPSIHGSIPIIHVNPSRNMMRESSHCFAWYWLLEGGVIDRVTWALFTMTS